MADARRTRILRISEVQQVTGLSRSSLYKLIQERHFPRQVPLGSRSVGWFESEVQAWITGRAELRNAFVAEKQDDTTRPGHSRQRR